MKVVLFMTLLNSSLRYSRYSVIREDCLDSTSGTVLDVLLIWITSKLNSGEVFSVPKSAYQSINSWKPVTFFIVNLLIGIQSTQHLHSMNDYRAAYVSDYILGVQKKPPIFKCGSILLTHDVLAKCCCHYIVYSLQSIWKQLDVK